MFTQLTVVIISWCMLSQITVLNTLNLYSADVNYVSVKLEGKKSKRKKELLEDSSALNSLQTKFSHF